MRTKLSSTAHESGFKVQTPTFGRSADWAIKKSSHPGCEAIAHEGAAQDDEALLHDVRNLVSSVALYCDLLSMPHVLRPEHRHYADELRLLGERSAALIERLMGAGLASRGNTREGPSHWPAMERRALQSLIRSTTEEQPRFEGLRPMVERCAGLLQCVASGRPVEIVYGDAAALTVRVPAESIERILVNLVRNATAAMGGRRGRIRLAVGQPPGHESGTRPWPFQRVGLTVLDSGCGMAPAEIEELLFRSDPAVPHRHSSHGIGFRVVRELVEASHGELSIQSRPGEGTRVAIEWPVAQFDLPGLKSGLAPVGLAQPTRRSA